MLLNNYLICMLFLLIENINTNSSLLRRKVVNNSISIFLNTYLFLNVNKKDNNNIIILFVEQYIYAQLSKNLFVKN